MPITDPGTGRLLTPPFAADPNRLEAAISLDGGATAVTDWQVFSVPAGGGVFTVGGPSLLWGRSWTAEEFSRPGLALMLRRPAGDGATTQRLVDHAYLAVHHTAGAETAMPERVSGKQIILFAPETTKGTKRATGRRMMAAVAEFTPALTQESFRSQGDGVDTIFPVVDERADGTLSGKACFNEIGWLLSSLIAKPVTTTATTGVFDHEFIHSISGNDDPHSFSFEIGDLNVRAHSVVYALLSSFSLGGPSRQTPAMSGSFIAKGFADGITLTAGTNEVQTLTISGTPTGGSYTLRYKGVSTAPLAHNALAAAIQTALQGLSSVGSGNLLVSGTGPFVITAAGAFAGQELERIQVTSALTGGSTPTATIVKTTKGGYAMHPVVPILGNPEIFAASSFEGLSAGKLTKVGSSTFKADGRWNAATYQNGTLTWDEHYEDASASKFSVDLRLQADSSGMAYLPRARSQEQVYLRKLWLGPEITPGFRHQLEIIISSKVASVEPFGDDDGIYAFGYNFGAARDNALGWSVKVILRNTVTSYAS